jgi:hypothetical protein
VSFTTFFLFFRPSTIGFLFKKEQIQVHTEHKPLQRPIYLCCEEEEEEEVAQPQMFSLGRHVLGLILAAFLGIDEKNPTMSQNIQMMLSHKLYR